MRLAAPLRYEPTELIQPTRTDQLLYNDRDWAARQGFWGYLEPLDKRLPYILFHKNKNTYRIGRGGGYEHVDYILPDPRISSDHCQIIWDGREDLQSKVEVWDESSNFTYINNLRMLPTSPDKQGRRGLLRDGDLIAFADPDPPQPGANPSYQDNRYRYHHVACQMVISQILSY